MPTQPYYAKRKPKFRLPGATTVNANLGWGKEGLLWWAWNEGMNQRNYKDSRQKEADVGTVAHTLIECNIKGEKFSWENPDVIGIPFNVRDEYLERAMKSLKNFEQWKPQVSFIPIGTEIPLASEHYLYGGCLDCVAIINGEIALFDWKSSKKSGYAEYELQTAAYVNLWNEAIESGTMPENIMSVIKVYANALVSYKMTGGIYILRIDKDELENWEIKHIGNNWRMDLALNTFLHLIPVHYAHKVLEKKSPIDTIEDWMWWPEVRP